LSLKKPLHFMKKITKTNPRLFQKGKLAKFLIVGATNTAISYIIFIILLNNINVPHAAGLAQAAGYAAGILWAYFWNRIWTFKSKAEPFKEGMFFLVSQLVLLIVSSVALHILVDQLKLPASVAWFCVMGVITIINYIVQKTFVYRS